MLLGEWFLSLKSITFLQSVRSMWPRANMLLLEDFNPHIPYCTHFVCWHLQCCVAMTGAATSSWGVCDVLPSFHLLVDLSAFLCAMYRRIYILVLVPVGARHLPTWHGLWKWQPEVFPNHFYRSLVWVHIKSFCVLFSICKENCKNNLARIYGSWPDNR